MTSDLVAPFNEERAGLLTEVLDRMTGLHVYKRSITVTRESICFLGRNGVKKSLGLISDDQNLLGNFNGASSEIRLEDQPKTIILCPTTSANAAALRASLPFLTPTTLGLKKSAGCGDRLGLATPGHIRALRHSTMAGILAQQSIRENTRTGRAPQQVMDDAMWGVFQEGWREGFGADADHLKNTADIDSCAAAGFTFYTIDPSEHVDNEANTAPFDVLRTKIEALPWAELETSWMDTQSRLNDSIDLGDFKFKLDP